jgi:CTP:molybdopterin cytidylyltransferase MocA
VTALGLVLAAGAGRRAGGPKAELLVGGERLVDRAVATAHGGGCDAVIVVTRPGPGDAPSASTMVVNPDPDRGMGSSLQLGLQAASGTDAATAIVLLVDQPGITPAAIARVLRAGGDEPRLCFATYAGVRAHPVRIDRALWADVARSARGDVGARAFARANPGLVDECVCDGLADPTDLDTPADLTDWERHH